MGFISKNKYSILSSTRTVVILLNLELLLNFFIVCLTLISESLSFTQIVSLQSNFKWNLFTFLPIIPVFFIIFTRNWKNSFWFSWIRIWVNSWLYYWIRRFLFCIILFRWIFSFILFFCSIFYLFIRWLIIIKNVTNKIFIFL